MRAIHPATSDHSLATLRRLSELARELSHDEGVDFDDLQEIANLLSDWAAVKAGYQLAGLDGVKIDIFSPEVKD